MYIDPHRERNILIVDDNPSFRSNLERLVHHELDTENIPHRVMQFHNAEDAHQWLTTPNNRAAMAFVDVELGNERMTGPRLCEEIAAARIKLPVALMTGKDERAFSRRDLLSTANTAGGVRYFLSKPVELPDVSEAMHECLNTLNVALVGYGNVARDALPLLAKNYGIGTIVVLGNVFDSDVDPKDGMTSVERARSRVRRQLDASHIGNQPISPIEVPEDVEALQKHGIHAVVYTLMSRKVDYMTAKRQGRLKDIRRRSLQFDVPSIARYGHRIAHMNGYTPHQIVLTNPLLECMEALRVTGNDPANVVGLHFDAERTQEIVLHLISRHEELVHLSSYQRLQIYVTGLHDQNCTIPDFHGASLVRTNTDRIPYMDTELCEPKWLERVHAYVQLKALETIQQDRSTTPEASAKKIEEYLMTMRRVVTSGKPILSGSHTLWTTPYEDVPSGFLTTPEELFAAEGDVCRRPRLDLLTPHTDTEYPWRCQVGYTDDARREYCARDKKLITMGSVFAHNASRRLETSKVIERVLGKAYIASHARKT